MNRLKKLSLAALLALGMYGSNKIIPAILIWNTRNYQFLNEKIQEKMPVANSSLEEIHINSLSAYYYVKYSNEFSCKYFKLAKNIDASDITSRLSDSTASCAIMSETTFSNYIYFVKKSENLKLMDSVRLASGFFIDKGERTGHQWIEYKLYGKWTPFETTIWADLKGVSSDQGFNNQMHEDWNIDKNKYIPIVYTYVSKNLITKNCLNWRNIFIQNDIWEFYQINKKLL